MAVPLQAQSVKHEGLSAWNVDGLLFGIGVCCVPMSIAVAEIFLAGALLFRTIALVCGRAHFELPRVFWFWLAWAALEAAAWLRSPEIRAGFGEMRHLLLIAALFLLAPALGRADHRVTVWSGIAITASVSSLYLIGHFVWQLLFYRGPLDPVVYLRNGGLLHNWMVYGTVEIIALAGMLELWHYFPEKRAWLVPVLAINAVAIVLSLTRMLWIASLILVVLHLAWRRSRWLWAAPVLAGVFLLLVPGPVRSRIADSMHSDYYSNAERIQMFEVGWKMIREHPLSGVGPGRVEELYTKYLSASDYVPAYHGHLHNNLVQLTAEFGLPVAAAALLFIVVLLHDLWKQSRLATDRGEQFLFRTAVLALTGFLIAGLFDFTYGHALGLIMLSFAVLLPMRDRANGLDS